MAKEYRRMPLTSLVFINGQNKSHGYYRLDKTQYHTWKKTPVRLNKRRKVVVTERDRGRNDKGLDLLNFFQARLYPEKIIQVALKKLIYTN